MKSELQSLQKSILHQLSSSSTFYMVGLLLLFFAGMSGSQSVAMQSGGVTDINVSTTVKTPNVRRLGINLSGQSFYDSGQMLRNLAFRNPGFEGETWRSVLQCKSISGDGCYSDDQWSNWPKDFLKGATITFVTGTSRGLTGTVSGLDPANSTTGIAALIHMSGLQHAPTAGDYYIVEATMPGGADKGWWTSANGGATFSTEFSDLSPHSPGKQALHISAASSGQSANIHSYFDSTSGRSFVQLKGNYTLSFRAKSTAGSNQLNVQLQRVATSHGNVSYLNQQIALTTNWQDYTFPITANEDGTYIGTVDLGFAIAGGSVLLDDVSLVEEAASDNPTPFRNAVVERLRELRPGVLRYMDNGTDFGSTIDNMLAPPFARVRAGFSQNANVREDIPIGLVEFLQLAQAVGAEPWFSVPMTCSPQEFQNLIQFLNGDTSTKYGALRASLGQSAPWTSVFPMIHLELGNENWNVSIFSGATIGDPIPLAQRTTDVFTAAKAAPEYNSAKFDLIMNGWAAVPWFTQQEGTVANNVDTVDFAPYTFGALNDYSSNENIFGPMFAEPEAVDSLSTGSMFQQVQAAASAPHPMKAAVYEVNLTTVKGTASQAMVNAVVPSVGAGISVIDHMLLMMRDDGITLQNLFALPEYANGFSNTNGGNETTPLWGAVVDMGGATNLCRPQFLAEMLANTAITGDLLTTTQTGANPIWSQATNTNTNVATPQAHYLQSFAFSDGTNHGVIVFNLSRTTALPVTFSGANAPTGAVKIGQLTSHNLTDTNEQNSVVGTTNNTVSAFNGSQSTLLPPFSMTVFTWTGSGTTAPPPAQSTTTSLTASPTQVGVGKPISLTAAVTAASGTPDGTVSFFDGGSRLGTASLTNGTATVTISTLTAGTHSLTVGYAGTSAYSASTSPAVTVTVTAAKGKK